MCNQVGGLLEICLHDSGLRDSSDTWHDPGIRADITTRSDIVGLLAVGGANFYLKIVIRYNRIVHSSHFSIADAYATSLRQKSTLPTLGKVCMTSLKHKMGHEMSATVLERKCEK